MYNFKEGFCWSDISSTYLKCRIKEKSVNDVKSMCLYALCNKVPEFYIVSLINSDFIGTYVKNFINNTQTFQINDARQLPIIVPDEEYLCIFKNLFENAVQTKKLELNNSSSKAISERRLNELQVSLDETVSKLYTI